jgi:uncharacterized protein YcbK (DUF882 family)
MYTIEKDIALSKNFKLSEFACHDGSGKVLFTSALITKLQLLRDKLGKPIRIVSAYRTPEYNKKCGGAPKSQHMEGTAADIKVSGISPLDVAKAAESVGFTGIGVYTHSGNSFTHVDVRPSKSHWMDLPGHQLKSVKSLNEIKKG